MVSYGITASCEMQMKRDSNLHRAYQELAENNELIIKAGMHYLVKSNETEADIMKEFANPSRAFDNKLSDGYFAKIFIDGVVENATAWLNEPY